MKPLCEEDMQSDSSQKSLVIPQGLLPKVILPNIPLISREKYLQEEYDWPQGEEN